MTNAHFRFEKDTERKVAYITFIRPEKLNVLVRADYPAIARLVNGINEDEDVKVLVLRRAESASQVGGG